MDLIGLDVIVKRRLCVDRIARVARGHSHHLIGETIGFDLHRIRWVRYL
jgi:hypothetical protein